MLLTIDSTFKRAIFIVIVIAISTVFAFTAFIYLPNLNQQVLTAYLIILEIIVLLTFFFYRDHTPSRYIYVKRLKNPRLQENAFEISGLLLKEFDYIRDISIQVMNDRQNMSNHYLSITGAIVGATVLAFLINGASLFSPQAFTIIMAVSLIINIAGWIYFMQNIRLRQAVIDGNIAMNQIKEFFIINGRVPDDIARSAFLWDTKTPPEAGKKNNAFFYSGILISLISALVILFASWVITPYFRSGGISTFTLCIALYHFIFQTICYSLFLDYKSIH